MNTKSSKNIIAIKAMTVIICLTAAYLSVMACYCDAFTAAGTAADNLVTKFVDLASKIFPLSMVLLIISILITHDQRMMTAELKVGGGMCVAYIALLIVKNGQFLETFDNLGIGGGTGGSIKTATEVAAFIGNAGLPLVS